MKGGGLCSHLSCPLGRGERLLLVLRGGAGLLSDAVVNTDIRCFGGKGVSDRFCALAGSESTVLCLEGTRAPEQGTEV